MGRFCGWPEQAYDTLFQLAGDPSHQVREGVRRDREELVRRPMIDLLNDLADLDPFYQDFSVWRYASTAYWWQNQCAIVRVGRNIELGFRFNLDGLRVQAAWWYADPEQIVRYRAAVAGPHGDRLGQVIGSLTALDYEILGDTLQRVPRGFPPQHPRADLLRHRSLIAARGLDAGGPVADVDPVHRCCEQLRPLLGWLTEHVTVA